jgi:glycosyltransferase involved in cell wall biosynthesis
MLQSALRDGIYAVAKGQRYGHDLALRGLHKSMMSNSLEIDILLATYNGERFLREQIDSILGQDYEHLRVLARDDGSSDGTSEILKDYAARFPDRFEVLPSENASGSAKLNFLLLMKAATADHICFCDQDDVWLPNKLSRTKEAMDRLKSDWGTNLPLLVFTDLQVVDDKLNQLHPSFWAYMGIDPERINHLNRLLVQGVVTGCTAMLNRRLLDLSLRMPEEASMHDRWIALIASTLGKHAIVKSPTILYRQHDRNVLGTGATQRPRALRQRLWRPDTQKYFEEWRTNQRQAAAFLRIHSAELPPRKRHLIAAFLQCGSSKNRFTRVASFLRYGFYRAGILPNLLSILNLWTKSLDEQQAS